MVIDGPDVMTWYDLPTKAVNHAEATLRAVTAGCGLCG